MVLVITGKGKMSEGVLRQAVPTWLRQAQLSIYVSAFRQAHITHGGSGALYVKLRKQEIR
jgi:DNA-nicking Smr family endonuclease